MQTLSEQIGVPCTILRGGSSKGIYFKAADLPAPGAERDRLLMAVLGAQGLLQIDGLGGSRLVTAKLAIVGPATHPDADEPYKGSSAALTDLIGGQIDVMMDAGGLVLPQVRQGKLKVLGVPR